MKAPYEIRISVPIERRLRPCKNNCDLGDFKEVT